MSVSEAGVPAPDASRPLDAASIAKADSATGPTPKVGVDGSVGATARASDAASEEDAWKADASPVPDAGSPCVPTAEVCDGKDNDCDDEVDEGLKNACGLACGIAVPAEDCATPADDNCDGTKNEGCAAAPPSCVAVAETCDSKDQDCDGVPDNGVKNACGACGAVPAEVCDGKDNDCDGNIDEGVKNACGACGAVPAEACDGKDNNCDGATDEGVKNACGGCGAVPAEVCDGKDNNCDNQIDEGFTTTWYRDCDADGYASQSAATAACGVQPPLAPGCRAWTPKAPGAGTTDCNDADSRVNPSSAFNVGETDFNCDGRIELQEELVFTPAGNQTVPRLIPRCAGTMTCDCWTEKLGGCSSTSTDSQNPTLTWCSAGEQNWGNFFQYCR